MNRPDNNKESTSGMIPTACGAIAAAAMLALFATGCSMCCGPHDFEYPMFQSRYARVDPEFGRVGSVFSDPNAMPGTRPTTNAEVPRKEQNLGMNDDDDDKEGPDDPDFQKDKTKSEDDLNPFKGEPDADDIQDAHDTAVKFRNPVPPRRR